MPPVERDRNNVAHRFPRLAFALEQFNPGMDREHLLDEHAPEVEQPHRKRSFILCVKRGAGLLEELAKIRTELNDVSGFAPTGCYGFEQNTVDYFAGTAEVLLVGKAVISAEPSDSLTFVGNEGEAWVRADNVTDPFELSVDRVLAE